MMIDVEESWGEDWYDSLKWLQHETKHIDDAWLGDGTTSTKIIETLKNSL